MLKDWGSQLSPRKEGNKPMTEYQCTESIPCWDLEEGKHLGCLIEFGEYYQTTRSGNTKKYFRLVFEVETGDPYKEYRAQKRYVMNEKVQVALEKDVKRWLGKKAYEERTSIQLQDLLGHKATLTIKHLHGDGYKKPFSVVKSIGPAKAVKQGVQTSAPALV
jgi:hypothetical protein